MLVVKCKPLFVQPIAHEVVFKDSYERTIQNAFRFVFMSYMYHKGLYLRDLVSRRDDLTYATVHNNLYINSHNTVNINAKLAVEMCNMIGADFTVMYNIARQFVKNTDYNAISFSSDGNPVFFKGFMKRFGY